MPSVTFYLSAATGSVNSNHPLWSQPLPNQRPGKSPPPHAAPTAPCTYGDYFTAVARFCSTDEWSLLLKAVSKKQSRRLLAADLEHLSIVLEKHGAFYHPARLLVTAAGETVALVVNVATSEEGRRTLPQEINALQRLHHQRPFGWFPEVYGSNAMADPPLFLGDWFDGFHEFHLTRPAGGNELAIRVWDEASPGSLLSENQSMDLYRKAAMILAACYDPLTARQIFPWHHAAGDFVVKVQAAGVSVRLVTVRDYAPMTGLAPAPDSLRKILDTLVLFFIHLSIRMRLDRLEGVGEILWAPGACLKPMVDGFFEGLGLTARLSGLPETFPGIFQRYCNRHSQAVVLTLAHHITEAVFDRKTEERRVVLNHLDRHIHRLCRLLSTPSAGVRRA